MLKKCDLSHLKNTVLSSYSKPVISNSALFVLYLQQCHSTSMPFSFQGPQVHMRLGRPLPEADINACVPIAWPGVLKNFRTSANIQDMEWISGPLLKFQDIAQASTMLYRGIKQRCEDNKWDRRLTGGWLVTETCWRPAGQPEHFLGSVSHETEFYSTRTRLSPPDGQHPRCPGTSLASHVRRLEETEYRLA